MNFNLPYNPKEVEDKIYKLWEKSGFFTPENLPQRHKIPFTIVLPPPNVTAALHMGSALMLVIQDIMIRFERMRGKKTLWLPGTDHASIATEEKFLKEKKISKNDYADKRDEFIKLITEFALQNQSIIIKQMRAMGASLDWTRLAFTLDEKRKKAVEKAFMRMNDAGLIYAGEYLVNWDLKGQTTVSDDEIVYETEEGTLYTFMYSSEFPIPIATTLPETKLGDVAVAVHPEGKWKDYIGQNFLVDFLGVKLGNIEIVGDEIVNPEFGTGAVGITPAHSKTDYDIAYRHNILRKENKLKQVINEYGKIDHTKQFDGLKIEDARLEIIKQLKANKLLLKEEKIIHEVPKAQRSGGTIITLPKRQQFFINVNKPIPERENKTLKELMREPVVDGRIKILPARFERVYFQWIDNLRDWNISRQIWYGHPIPNAWHRGDDVIISVESPGKNWTKIVGETLDTWFSSGLWTFSTLGWPEQTADLKTFHPTSVLETGYDILFFWVARMILMSQFHLGEIPFKTVYLHGLVRDEKNRKISKSLGNNIDPIDMIKQYGADAVRMAMIIGTSVGNDSKVSLEKFKAYKHFANKIWNISRFVLINLPEDTSKILSSSFTKEDKQITADFNKFTVEITKDMQNFRFYLAAEKIYHYIWHTFADKIIEDSKIKLTNNDQTIKTSTQRLLLELLVNSLKLLHPFMPFITEEIWQTFGKLNKSEKLIMVENWPN